MIRSDESSGDHFSPNSQHLNNPNLSLKDNGKKYAVIDHQIRVQLLKRILSKEATIKEAAKEFGVNFSTAKAILQTYRKEGRIGKKKTRERNKKKKDDSDYHFTNTRKVQSMYCYFNNNLNNSLSNFFYQLFILIQITFLVSFYSLLFLHQCTILNSISVLAALLFRSQYQILISTIKESNLQYDLEREAPQHRRTFSPDLRPADRTINQHPLILQQQLNYLNTQSQVGSTPNLDEPNAQVALAICQRELAQQKMINMQLLMMLQTYQTQGQQLQIEQVKIEQDKQN